MIGSRDYSLLNVVSEYIESLSHDEHVVASGCARGVDQHAVREARNLGIHVIEIPALWEFYGPMAGYARNGILVDFCDSIVAFWDGESRGTLNTIQRAQSIGKPLTVYGPDGSPRDGSTASGIAG